MALLVLSHCWCCHIVGVVTLSLVSCHHWCCFVIVGVVSLSLVLCDIVVSWVPFGCLWSGLGM
ncbi:7484_t:CDS:2 [Gigaspora rosea]|nr:7484_t:CDS:2 [Gigaspora rosea]